MFLEFALETGAINAGDAVPKLLGFNAFGPELLDRFPPGRPGCEVPIVGRHHFEIA